MVKKFSKSCNFFQRQQGILNKKKAEGCPPAIPFFLDIYMPEMKGTDLAVILRKQSFTGPIVFLTSSNEFAAESYEVKAHAYLLKPVDKKKLFHQLDEFRVLIHKNNAKSVDDAHIILNTKSSKTILYYRDIKWVEVKAHALFAF